MGPDPKLFRGIAFGLLLIAPFWITIAYLGLVLWIFAAFLMIVGWWVEVSFRKRNNEEHSQQE